MASKGNPWMVGNFSSAAGVIVQYPPDGESVMSTASFGVPSGRFNLRGYTIAGSTAVAVSTLVISLRYGDSSAGSLTTLALTKEPGAQMTGANGLMGLSAGVFQLYSSVAHSDGGLVATLFGD